MKNFKKSFIALLTSFMMVLQVLPLTSFAEQSESDSTINVRVIIENNTYTDESAPWTGVKLDKSVDIESGSSAIDAIKAALDSENVPYESSTSYIKGIDGLKEYNGGYMSGWMGSINDWFSNVPLSAYTLDDCDEVKLMYTCEYGEDLGSSWSNNDKTLKDITSSVGSLSPKFSKDIHKYTLTVPKGTKSTIITPTASNKNFQVRTSVYDIERKRNSYIPIEDGIEITVKCGDPSWPSMNGGDYGTADSVPAEIYTIKVVEQDTVVENHKMTISSDSEKGSFDVNYIKYDEDFTTTTDEVSLCNSYEIDLDNESDYYKEISLTPQPKPGYEFNGWIVNDVLYEKDSDFTNVFGGLSNIDPDTGVLYLFNYDDNGIIDIDKDYDIKASYLKESTFDITFDADNGEDNIVKEVNKGQSLDYTPEKPVKDGYVFVGWYKDVDNINTKYESGKQYNKDTVFTAKYAHVSMIDAQAQRGKIKFKTQLYNDGDEIIEKGTLILPENLLPKNQFLQLSTKRVAKSVGKFVLSKNEDENYITYLGTLVNIPDSQYDRKMIASSYVKYKDKSGQEYTVYSPYPGGSVSVNDLLSL